MKNLLSFVILVILHKVRAWSAYDSFHVRPASRNKLQTVNAYRYCGGTGHILEVREEGCEKVGHANGHDQCLYQPDSMPRIRQLDFIPVKDIQQLAVGHQIVLQRKAGDPMQHWYNVIPNSTVKAGQKSTVSFYFTIEPELEGTMGELRIELYDHATKIRQACGEATFLVADVGDKR